MAATEAWESIREPSGSRPPSSSICPKARTSSTVDTRPPAAEGNAGGLAHWPLGGSYTLRSPVTGSRP